MPGLVGFTKRNRCDDSVLVKMRQLLKHFEWYKDDEIYMDKHICASGTHLGIVDQGEQLNNLDKLCYAWMEGEWYNQDELKTKYGVTAGNDNELLLNSYLKTDSFEFLRDVDGYYAAVIYDKIKESVFLITDRYGLKPLYWMVIDGNLVWTSELKGFLEHKDFSIKMNPLAIKEFFDIGYLLECRTWFEGVELMPPSAVLAFNISGSKSNDKLLLVMARN
jgi:asparagine synthase (glutamine-hydrolysing)